MSLDLKLFATVFATVFVAELGDKTQLATFSFAAAGQRPLSVFLGASLALVAASSMAVLLGTAAQTWLPREWVRIGAGALFIGAGLLILLNRG